MAKSQRVVELRINLAICAIVVLLLVQRAHLVRLADVANEQEEATLDVADDNGDAQIDSRSLEESSFVDNDIEGNSSEERAFNLGDFLSPSSYSKSSTDGERADRDKYDADDFGSAKTDVDPVTGAETIAPTNNYRVGQHSTKGAYGEPRVISGFGLGLGKGLIG